jgi:hypothetical protein
MNLSRATSRSGWACAGALELRLLGVVPHTGVLLRGKCRSDVVPDRALGGYLLVVESGRIPGLDRDCRGARAAGVRPDVTGAPRHCRICGRAAVSAHADQTAGPDEGRESRLYGCRLVQGRTRRESAVPRRSRPDLLRGRHRPGRFARRPASSPRRSEARLSLDPLVASSGPASETAGRGETRPFGRLRRRLPWTRPPPAQGRPPTPWAGARSPARERATGRGPRRRS